MEKNKAKASKNGYLVKGVIATMAFHLIYTFVFGMLVGGKNPLIFLYEKDYIIWYMILTPLIFSLPYVIAGYLIVLGINTYEKLKSKIRKIALVSFSVIFFIYVVSFAIQFFFPYRDIFGVYIFVNYPAASYLIVMDFMEYSQNLLVILSVLFPAMMIYVGGKIRIKGLDQGAING